MRTWTSIQERYLKDNVSVRLGGLAANLLRISSYADRPEHEEVVSRLVRESALFIEWTASDVDVERLIELARLQRELAAWHRDWSAIWGEASARGALARGAKDWSDRVLELSGLTAREA
jgi:hypothetical protein